MSGEKRLATLTYKSMSNRCININGQGKRENEEGVARGTVQDNDRGNDNVDEVDEIEVGSCKRERRDSVPLCHGLLRVVAAVLTTDPP